MKLDPGYESSGFHQNGINHMICLKAITLLCLVQHDHIAHYTYKTNPSVPTRFPRHTSYNKLGMFLRR